MTPPQTIPTDSGGEEEGGGGTEPANNIYTQNTEEVLQSMENAANELCVATLSPANPHVITFPDADGQPRIIIAHDYLSVIATSQTTLEQLASLYLNNPDMAQAVALINGITGDDEIAPGDTLKIPVASSRAPNHSLVFNKTNRRDAAGVDIALKNGRFIFERGGEFAAVSGRENISNMRLAERLGNRMRLSVYGIRNVAGMPEAVAAAYIAASVKDTVLHDPRIERVENLFFQGKADSLYIEFDYDTKDGALQKY